MIISDRPLLRRRSSVWDDQAILDEACTILRKRLKRLGTLSSPGDTKEFLRMRLAGLEHELFYVLYLDTRHRIIEAEVAFHGTIDGAEVHPRVIVKRALELNAAALICAHNHPSNDPTPSTADHAVTQRLKSALALVDVRLLDHFVVTVEGFTSLAEMGRI